MVDFSEDERRPKGFFHCKPNLPDHLDRLLDLPWSPEASRLLDSWLWWLEREFEGVD